jgi:hypothetical protein
MLLQARKHFERLQTIDFKFLEEVIVGLELFARDVEMARSEIQNFRRGLVDGSCHGLH